MSTVDRTHSFYEEQAANRRKTAFLIGAFLVLFAALGYGFDWFFGLSMRAHGGGLGFPLPVFCLIGFGLGALSTLSSYFNGDRQVLNATGAKPADPNAPEQKQLLNVV